MTVDKKILENWKTLNDNIKQLSEEEIEQLLKLERKGERRTQFLLRLYGRYNTLRCVRERKEILAE